MKVGEKIAFREWDDSLSRGVVRALSEHLDLVVVEFDNGDLQRMSLKRLKVQVAEYRNLN